MDYKGKSICVLLKDKTILRHKIVEDPIARGGEGVIYRFEHKEEEKISTFILKLYHSTHKAARNKAKVRCMFNNPVQSADPNVRFCWPIGLVYDNRTYEFYGFAMQEAFSGSRNLEILSTYYVNVFQISFFINSFSFFYQYYNIFSKKNQILYSQ